MCVSDEAWAPAVGFEGAFPSAGRLKREELGAGEGRQGQLFEGVVGTSLIGSVLAFPTLSGGLKSPFRWGHQRRWVSPWALSGLRPSAGAFGPKGPGARVTPAGGASRAWRWSRFRPPPARI
jgi:hypothetical protein